MVATGEYAAELRGIAKRYADIVAVDYIDLDIKYGEILGLLGPNGSGKSTTLKIILGLVKPDSGSMKVLGINAEEDPVAIKRLVGYVPESPRLYEFLTGLEYLDFTGDIYGINASDKKTRIEEYLEALDLEGREGDMISSYSQGMKQKIALISAFLHKPKLLILDEPTVGLDPTQIVEIRHLIRRLAQHSTILFSTHILSEVEALCDRVIILMNGQVKADSRLSDLSTTADAIVVLQEEVSDFSQAIKSLEGVADIETINNGYPTFRILGQPNADLCPAIYNLARDKAWPIRELKRDVQTLETVFNKLATEV